MAELRHLRHFVAVAEELNFTRAAGRLFLAQQALSASIRQLEQELGEALFVRDTRRVALTPAGETLLPRARRLLGMAEETVAAVRAGEPTRPVLRVDISSSNLQTGALVLRRLREEHRDIEVRQREPGHRAAGSRRRSARTRWPPTARRRRRGRARAGCWAARPA
jgi:DNA-binding transcriptional LysR family regulator